MTRAGCQRRAVGKSSCWAAVLLVVALSAGGNGCRREAARQAVGQSAPASAAATDGRANPARVGGLPGPAGAASASSMAGFDGRPEASATTAALPAEERESHPESQMVTIKIVVEPPQRAHVYWGAKDLGLAPLEIQRPRGSGPLDLVLKAPGYLTLHTRALTDRNDKISVRLIPEAEAPLTFGYRAR